MMAAQNVRPVVKPHEPKMTMSEPNDGAVEYHRSSAPVAISEKQISTRGFTRSASQPLGR